MKQAQSLIETKNEHNKKYKAITQNSDGDIPYTSLLTNEYALEDIFCNEGRYFTS